MLTSPRKTKYKKVQKGSIPNQLLSKTEEILYGKYAIKAMTFGVITNQQLEAARRLITKKNKKTGQIMDSSIHTYT